MNREEIKDYVIKTIRSGNRDRIIKVLSRYEEWIKKNKNGQKSLVEHAEDIFNTKAGN